MTLAQLRSCALGMALLLTVVSPSQATDRTIRLALGADFLLTLDTPFESVLIDDSNVLRVSVQTDRTIVLKGLNCGASNIVFLDSRSMALTNIKVVVSEVPI